MVPSCFLRQEAAFLLTEADSGILLFAVTVFGEISVIYQKET